MPKLYKFSIPGIKCGACAANIESASCSSDNIKIEKTYVNVADKTVTFKVADTALSENEVKQILIATVKKRNFTCVEIQQASRIKALAAPRQSIRSHVTKGIIGIIAGSVLLGLCIAGITLPFIALYCLGVACSLLTFFLGKESYYEAAVGLKHKRVTMDTLFSISTLIALGVSLVSIGFPWLPMMYDAALLIFGFRHIGKAIEESVNGNIEKKLTFRSRAPEVIEHLAPSGKRQKILVQDLLPGEWIIVRRGETVPVDGECETEKAAIYNTVITGRTVPQMIKKGDLIYAGSTVDVDEVRIRVKKTEAESYLARLDACLSQPGEEAPLERWANNIMKYFVPTVLALAFISAITIGVLFSPLTALQCAVAILVSACPCTFGLITPLAVKIGIVKAAADGVRFKSGKPLQAAGEVDTVVLDLNGTLTTGQPKVIATNIQPRWLNYLARIEQESTHPFAKAICEYHTDKTIPSGITYLDQSNHAGIVAAIQGETYIIGNKTMMLDRGFTEIYTQAAEIRNHSAEHVVYFARGKTLLGCILLHDPLREDAKATVDALKRLGKEVHLCTGADKKTANHYAALLGIDKVLANCIAASSDPTIQTKTTYIASLKQQGRKVAMVGDAANDAPAIKESHLGIAVKSAEGDKITQQEAGAVINSLNNQLSLRPIITALTVGKQTVRNIHQNLTFSLCYNMLTLVTIGCLFACLGFIINPAIGAALMVLQAAIILANAYRFQQEKPPYANDLVLSPTVNPEAGRTSDIQRALQILPKNNIENLNDESPHPNASQAPTELPCNPLINKKLPQVKILTI